jgi:hypothetical protein
MSTGDLLRRALEVRERLATAEASIYEVPVDRPDLLYDTPALQALLEREVVGQQVLEAIRTRSKNLKQLVCAALGYKDPGAFSKTHPRFPAQDLDVHGQQSNNVQIYNQTDLDPRRRHALFRIDDEGWITGVRVIDGETLARLDKTKTVTSKFQAARRSGDTGSSLVTALDSTRFQDEFSPRGDVPAPLLAAQSPIEAPVPGLVLSIGSLYERLAPLEGATLSNVGLTQERNRGAGLHRVVCEMLGLGAYADSGQFPDIRSQALEVKLQTSPTIDLGLFSPDSEEPAVSLGRGLCHADTRYLVAYGERSADKETVKINAVVLTTGEHFFDEFTRFGGLGSNKKFQIRLPNDFFELPVLDAGLSDE